MMQAPDFVSFKPPPLGTRGGTGHPASTASSVPSCHISRQDGAENQPPWFVGGTGVRLGWDRVFWSSCRPTQSVSLYLSIRPCTQNISTLIGKPDEQNLCISAAVPKAEALAGCALLMGVKALRYFCPNMEKISNPLLHGFLAKKSDLCFF